MLAVPEVGVGKKKVGVKVEQLVPLFLLVVL
jgi:hypothetical protein